jgi:hypothetical protein
MIEALIFRMINFKLRRLMLLLVIDSRYEGVLMLIIVLISLKIILVHSFFNTCHVAI